MNRNRFSNKLIEFTCSNVPENTQHRYLIGISHSVVISLIIAKKNVATPLLLYWSSYWRGQKTFKPNNMHVI